MWSMCTLFGWAAASTSPETSDDSLALLQLQSRHEVSVQQDPDPNAILTPDIESVTLRPAGTLCPDGEVLTYWQCTQAMRAKKFACANWARGSPNGQYLGPQGCYYATSTKWCYYNPTRDAGSAMAILQPVCGPKGKRKQEVLDSPVDPMPKLEAKPLRERCAPGCSLNFDQCMVATAKGLAGNPAQGYAPITQVYPGGFACYSVISTHGVRYMYWNPTPDASRNVEGVNLPTVAHIAHEICNVCDTTTTTTTDSGHVCKHYETEDTCPDARCSWDGDACTDPPCSSHTEKADCCGDCEWEKDQCQPAMFKACPTEGKPGTNVCPEGCTFVDNCEQCEFAAGVWEKDYSTEPWKPKTGSRPQGCFRNRKFNIKCNKFEPGSKYPSGVDKVGTKKGKWPICKLIEPPKKC